MLETIPRSELSKLPFVRNAPDDGRVVALQSCFDHSSREWYLYVPVRPGELGRMAGGEPVSGSYYSTTAVDTTRDLEFPLGTLVTQHLSFPKVLRSYNKLENDVHRCSAILEKYDLLSTRRTQGDVGPQLLVESELEYLVMLLRSFYDLLQESVKEVSALLVNLDGTHGKVVKRQLPSSFAEMVLNGNHIRTNEEIGRRWSLPEPLILWFLAEAPFFRELRGLRDGIAHHGRNPPTIFSVEWGFAIDPTAKPWNRLSTWAPEQLWDGRLGSLRGIFAAFILHTLQATTRFTGVMRSIVKLPPAVADDIRLFVRSPFGHRLVSLEAITRQPWEGLEAG